MKLPWKPLSLCAVVIAVAIGAQLTGCGSGGTSKIRFLNLSPDSPSLNVLVDGKTITNSLGFGAPTSYVSISSGTRHIQCEPVGTTTNVVDVVQSIPSGNTTFIVENFAASIKGVAYPDSQTVPASGEFQVRVINAAPSLGAADIYVLPFGTDVNTVTPTAANQPVGMATPYLSLSAGSYAISFTQPNFKNVLISSGSVTFNANTNRTIVGYTSQFGTFGTLTLADFN